MTRARLVLILVMLGALLTALLGCTPMLSKGTVVDKSYSPPSTYVQLVCAGYTQQGACSTYVPITHTAPEHYALLLDDGEDQGWAYVTPAVYDRIEVGDNYPEDR